LDKIPKPVVVALLRASDGWHANDHRRFRDTALNPSWTMGSLRRRDENSRSKVQNVRKDSSAVSQSVGLSPAWAKTQIDRRRFMAKEKNAPTTNYYVQGENARVNVNITDHSVNIVMKSTEEFFGSIKQKIESGVPEGDERRKILDALTALQESHGKPTFGQRYTEFIAAAADYVTLLTPFIPQLTQMLGHVLK
jgi:hypothetical protein